MNNYEKEYQEFNEEICNVIESYKEKLPPFEVFHAMISMAANGMLHTAPSELLAIETIMTSVQVGIEKYKEDKNC